MNKVHNDSLKQAQVLAFIKRKQPVDQAIIINHFYDKFGYKNMISSRVAIGRILKNIEMQGLAKKKSAMNESKGSIEKNIWSAT